MPINNPHQHGINNNQVPIGRSARDTRKYGLSLIGAQLSTQLPLTASATWPGLSGFVGFCDIWCLYGCKNTTICKRSTL